MIKKALFFASLILLGCSPSVKSKPLPEPFKIDTQTVHYGIDPLALVKMCSVVTQTLRPNEFIGALQGTFGNPAPCMDSLLSTGNVSGYRMHLVNGPCARNHNCAANEPKPTDYRTITARARIYEKLALKYPNVPCYLSGVLEHDLPQAQALKVMEAVKSGAPHCTFVQSIFTGYVIPGELTERHGNTSKADFVSNDGASIFDANLSSYRGNGSKVVLGWDYSFNGNVKGGKFIPPLNRTQFANAFTVNKVLDMIMSGSAPSVAWTVKDNVSLKGCDAVLDSSDGDKKGFLSKESDVYHQYAWTILLPSLPNNSNYTQFQVLKAGKSLYRWSSPYLYTEDKSNRPVWRADHSPEKAPMNVVVKAKDTKGKFQCWKINDPTQRVD